MTMSKNTSRYEEFLKDIQEITQAKVQEWWKILDKMGLTEKTIQWNDIFKQQVIELYDEMIEEGAAIQNQLLNNIEILLQKSQTLCKNLHLKMPSYGSEGLSLYEEEEHLIKRVKKYEELLEDRMKEINALNKEEIQLCQVLGREPRQINVSPLPSHDYISDFKEYLESLEFEKLERKEKFHEIKLSIMKIVNELNFKPNLDFQQMVVSADEFMVTDSNMKNLDRFHQMIQRQYSKTVEEIMALKEKLNHLWEILSEDIQTIDAFSKKHTGMNMNTLAALQQEVNRCEALKKANIEEFVKRLRKELVNLWDQCHLTEEERQLFEYFHSSLYTEDLLSLHDIEIQKLKNYYDTNSDLFNLLKKRDELCATKLQLEQRANAPDRYQNRGGQLLKEERERNAVSKRIPKIEEQLHELAEAYESRVGKPFLSWGRTVQSIIREPHEIHDEKKRLKLSARKNQRGQVTPGKSLLDVTPCSSMHNLAQHTPSVSATKRKIAIPLIPSQRSKLLLPSANLNGPKLCGNGPAPGPSGCYVDLTNENSPSEYDDFNEGLCSRKNCRSTLIGDTSPLAVSLPAIPNIVVTPSTSPRD